MAQTITKIEQSNVINILDTYNYTVVVAGPFMVKVDISEVPTSGITIALKQNSSTLLTTAAPTAGQQIISAQVLMNCAVNDVIGVVIASSNPQDSVLNAVKGILNIHAGNV